MNTHAIDGKAVPHSTMSDCYKTAKSLLQGFGSKSLVRNDAVIPTWIGETDCCWYERDIKHGREYRLVNTQDASNELAFDHHQLASALASVTDSKVNPANLPISHLELSLNPLRLEFNAFESRWCFVPEQGVCQPTDQLSIPATEVLSPNGTMVAFKRDYNFWIRNVASGEERALTADGEEDNAYCAGTTAWGVPQIPERPGLWSSDSKRFLTVQVDKRLVNSFASIDHVPLQGGSTSTFGNLLPSDTPRDTNVRPLLRQTKVAYPGDKYVEVFRVLCFDVESGEIYRADHHDSTVNYNDYYGFFERCLWWGNDSRTAYYIDSERGDQRFNLVAFDTFTGNTNILFSECSETHITFAGGSHGLPLNRYLKKTDELIWWSERSGWGHLYLYDLSTGELKTPVTQGNWRVRDVLYVDEQRREALIQTSGRQKGRDPYYRDICRVNLDTGELVTLLSEDREIIVHHRSSQALRGPVALGTAGRYTDAVSPNGDYLIAACSRIDQGAETILIDRKGNKVMDLEATDLFGLPENWQWPEAFEVISADGETPLYGTLFKPANFDSNKSYPILNFIGSGPWLSVVPKASFHSSKIYADRHYLYGAAMAQLGCIVMVLDSRGTALRSKAFQDESYGWVPSSANTDDHASAIDQLAERFSYIDKNRAGIFCQAYRSGLQNFMERQDLYKVCVQMLLLDDRMTGAFVSEKYEGLTPSPKRKLYPEDMAEGLQGKLMLMNSMNSALSTCYPPAATFRVIDALQRANKDFDMLIVPQAQFASSSYMFRRAFDFLTEHLIGETPPTDISFDDIAM